MKTPVEYRESATRVREMVAEFKSPQHKQSLLEIASQYDQLAVSAEIIERYRGN